MTVRTQTRLYALLAIVCLLMVGVSWADEPKTFTWTPPAERVDGTAIEAGELSDYELGCSASIGGPYTTVDEWTVASELDGVRIIAFAVGSHYCVLRVSNVAGFSDWSNEVFFSIVQALPNPPSLSVD